MNWIEIVQPDRTPIMISLSTVQAVGFRANPDSIQSPNAEKLYLQLKRLLKPKVLEF